jgi:protein-tyrosine phosphatase
VRPVFRKIKNWQIQRRLLRRHRTLLQRLATAGGPTKIVFLCYGNICRSPLAARLAEQRLSGIAIHSAGFHEQAGRSCPEKMLRIGNSFGIDLSGHRSARLTQGHLANADLVIVMDLKNLRQLRSEFPEIADRTTLLGFFGTPPAFTIADPYLAREAAARNICEQIRAGVEGLALWIASSKLAQYKPSAPPLSASSR